MKFVLTLLLACGLVSAQDTANSQPASSNVTGAQYPRVDDNGRASFQFKAPDAHTIKVDVGGAKYDMVKGGDGFWTATSAPLVPGFHYYSIIVDGLSVTDPSSETYFGVGKEYSGIEVPEKGVDFYAPKDVPHGDIREHWYYSKITGAWRHCFVYAPPAYDNSTKTRYPVLYLQHGSGEDERGWTLQGHVNFILDNLIAAGKAKPMLIVMDRGYAAKAGEPVKPTYPPTLFTGNVFEDVFVDELIPIIDSTYRTIPNREHRAMAGLSMGGMQTFQITLKHLDLFDYIGRIQRRGWWHEYRAGRREDGFRRGIKRFQCVEQESETDLARHWHG